MDRLHRTSPALVAITLLTAMSWTGCGPPAPTRAPDTPPADAPKSEPAATKVSATEVNPPETSGPPQPGSPEFEKRLREICDRKIAKLPVEEQPAARAQAFCPIMLKRLGAMGVPIKVRVAEKDVYICCEGCREELLADPAKAMAALKAHQATAK